MSLLDRYIARQYLINTVALAVVLSGFIVMIDVSFNLERFITNARESAAGDGEGSAEPSAVRTALVAMLLVADLWWPRLLHLSNFLMGLVLVAGMGFTCTQLVRHREFIALLASGQSLHRVVRPFVVVAVLLTAVQALNQELVIPRIAPRLTREHGEAYRRGFADQPVPLTDDGVGRLFYASSFDPDRELLSGLYVIERDGGGDPVRVIEAERAVWDGGGWVLEGGVAESRRGAVDGVRPAPEPVGRIETALDPTRLKMQAFAVYRQALGFEQLGRMLDREDLLSEEAADDLRRLRWGRFSVMAGNILTLLIAAPFFVTRLPTDFIGRTLRCAPLAAGSLLGVVFGSSAAVPGVPASLGVFLPLFVLAPLALASMGSIRS